MSCEEAALQEITAFEELRQAVAHRYAVDARLAVFDEHWEGYETALDHLEAALQGYQVALAALRAARSDHRQTAQP